MTQLALTQPTAVRQRLRMPVRSPEAETLACLDCDGDEWAVVVLKGADGVAEPLCAKHAAKRAR